MEQKKITMGIFAVILIAVLMAGCSDASSNGGTDTNNGGTNNGGTVALPTGPDGRTKCSC